MPIPRRSKTVRFDEMEVSLNSPSLTFNDILLRPRYSDIRSRAGISLRSRLIGDIYLNLPMLSSNMDTVTEHKMAIAMALNGGAGVLHR